MIKIRISVQTVCKRYKQIIARKKFYNVCFTLLQDITSIKQKLWKSFTYGGVNMTGFQLINKNKWTIKQTVHMERLGEFEPSVS